MELFTRTKGKAIILGSSLFFTFMRDLYDSCETADDYFDLVKVTLIDVGFMEILEDEDHRDWGFIKGL